MKRIKCGNKKGFTIIETSLVLAIAGLILVMVFIALPALQRQSRDTKRKDDTMLFAQALKKYQQNNRGALPDPGDFSNGYYSTYRVESWTGSISDSNPWAKFYNDYLGDDFVSPSGEKYPFMILGYDNGNPPSGLSYDDLSSRSFTAENLYIYLGAKCEGGKLAKSNNNRNVAVMTQLESGGAYCASN